MVTIDLRTLEIDYGSREVYKDLMIECAKQAYTTSV